MPAIQFNKNIPETLDITRKVFKPTGFSKLRLDNIVFIEGYDLANQVSIKVNGKQLFNVGALIGEKDVKANKTVNIHRTINCNVSDLL